MNKYKNKIPRDDLKRFAKEIAKKLVASDYKAGRVKDPTKIEERQQKKVKDFCKQFFDKAYQKHKKHEMEKAARGKGKKAPPSGEAATVSPGASPHPGDISPENGVEDDVKMSDDENGEQALGAETPVETNGSGSLKRKRIDAEGDDPSTLGEDEEGEATGSPLKRLNLDIDTPPPPPPPPAPPVETPPGSTPRESEGEGEGDVEMGTDIYADTNFAGKSMADVLAQAQEEDEDEGDDTGKDGPGIGLGTGMELDNPLVDKQAPEALLANHPSRDEAR